MPLGSDALLGLAGPEGTPPLGALPAPADPAGGSACAKACDETSPGRTRQPNTARANAIMRVIWTSASFNEEVSRVFPHTRAVDIRHQPRPGRRQAPSFDHLVGQGRQGCRNRETQQFGG